MFSCFGSDVFCSLLKRLPGARNTLLLCGMESHICVMQTALGALRDGYLVHVASDAVSSRTKWNWKIGLERMRSAGAIISSTEMRFTNCCDPPGRRSSRNAQTPQVNLEGRKWLSCKSNHQ